ncbi:MAG: mechanosensitive ion channel family protein, partial [Kamptonema sp. SIO4C4]|nr:mechanosensitive ion channel family protein [Kamptonema sp. SIO4C4]
MLNNWLQIEQEILQYVIELVIRLGIFALGAVLSPFIGRLLPKLLRQLLQLVERYIAIDGLEIYDRFIAPYQNALTLTGTFSFLAFCLTILIEYEDLYTFLGVFIYFALSVGIVWLASQIARQVIRRSVISLVQRWFGEVNEVVLIFEDRKRTG